MGAERKASSEQDDRSTATLAPGEKPLEKLRIGPYQVLRRLGEGGMGSVYLAVRDDREFKKYVAIKLIRKGMDSEEIVARFRRERQILAGLDHPNIAKLFDGGTTEEGLPYFVMEYITGLPLNEYCDTHKLNLKERLLLFQSMCSAVQYAHRNLIIHRDLKPANILVTPDGVPKLLDFGIAKVLNSDVFSLDAPPTEIEVRVMTPEYASPEQVRGDPLTTATDVYSLGIILYELLAGRRPYRLTTRSHVEVFRVVCEQEPGKPSESFTRKQESAEPNAVSNTAASEKLSKQLRGDLDNIILMALRKEPLRRYSSAQALSDDISRYLSGRTVSARKPTWSYRSGKYIRRHAAAVTAAALVLVLLIAFATTTSIQNTRIKRERNTAEQEKQKAEQVTKLLVGLFEINDPGETKGETISARELLDRGARRVREELKNQPDTRAQLLYTIGDIDGKLGLYDQAKPLMEESLKIRRGLYGNDHLAVAESLHGLGGVLWYIGEEDEAEKLFREGLAIRQKLLGSEHPDVAESLNDLASVMHDKGRLEEAEKLYRQALQIERKTRGNEHPEVATDLNNLSVILRSKGRLGEAEKMLREALAIDRRAFGNEHPDVAATLFSLAEVLRDEGRLDDAEKLYREALAIDRKVLGNEHPNLAMDLNNLANVLRDRGQFDEAEGLLREALAIDRKALGNEHPIVAVILTNEAEVLIAKGNTQEAVPLLNEALNFPKETIPEDSNYRARAESAFAACLMAQKKYPEAEKLLLKAYAVLSQKEKTSASTKRTYQRILDLYSAWGKPDDTKKFQMIHPA